MVVNGSKIAAGILFIVDNQIKRFTMLASRLGSLGGRGSNCVCSDDVGSARLDQWPEIPRNKTQNFGI
jgi:hypothetical protein